MTNPTKIAFLGAGNMATAIVRGVLAGGEVRASEIGATDLRQEAVDALADELGIRALANNREACSWAEIVVLAVKPQVLSSVLQEIADVVRADHLVVSIAAGVSAERIGRELNGRGRIVRAMPNTPALVGEGATAVARGPNAEEADLAVVERLLATTGAVVRIEERLMDAVTGLSGSGPAYAFVAIDALSDAGVRAGLTRDVATQLAAQTLLGAAKMVLATGEHPAKLKDMVTSPGGTTIAAIEALDRAGFRSALHDAVAASAARSRELSE